MLRARWRQGVRCQPNSEPPEGSARDFVQVALRGFPPSPCSTFNPELDQHSNQGTFLFVCLGWVGC